MLPPIPPLIVRFLLGITLILGARGPLWGAEAWEEEVHQLTVTLLEIPTVTTPDQPVPVRVRIRNDAEAPLAGEVHIGGPTGEIEPVSATTKSFVVEAGQSVETSFEIAVSAGAVRGEYPVHAFVEVKQGGEGTLRVSRTFRVEFPSAAGATEGGDAVRAVLELGRPPELSGLNGLLEQWRLDALGDYVRADEEPVEGGVFPLSPGADAFKVAVLPGEHGLLDGWFLFVGPGEQRLNFHGMHLSLRLPRGATASGENPSLQVDLARSVAATGSGGMAFEHFLSCGDWGSMVRIEVDVAEGGLRIRASGPDEVASLGLGPASVPPLAISGGRGMRIGAERPWSAASDPEFLDGPVVAMEFPKGLNLLVSSVEGFGRIEIDSSPGGARVEAAGGRELVFTPTSQTPYEWLLTTRKPKAPLEPALGRLWLDLDVAGFAATEQRIAELNRYDAGPKGVILRHWAAHGSRPRHPDSWPPDEALGGLAALRELESALNRWDIPWALDEVYSEISPLAGEFDYAAVAFGATGLPLTGRDGHYLLRPDRIHAWLRQNPVSAKLVALGQCDTLAKGFHDRSGHWFPGSTALTAWEEVIRLSREAQGGKGVVLVRSAGGEIPAGAAGALLPALETPRSATPVPWPVTPRTGRLRPLAGRDPKSELLAILSGDGLVVTHRDWGRDMVRQAWFLRPLVAAINAAPFTKIESSGTSHEQVRWEKGEGRVLWTNWSSQPWQADGLTLAPWGFRAVAPGIEVCREWRQDGSMVERAEGTGTWYVQVNPEVTNSPPKPLDCRILLGEPGLARVEVDWWTTSGLPFGTRPLVIAYPRDEPRNVIFESELHSAQLPRDWRGRITAASDLSLRDLPIGEFAVAVVLVTPGGRPLATAASEIEAHGRYGGYAARVGQLKIERIEDEKVQEIDFVPNLEGSAGTPAPTVESQRPLVDIGWASTNGGFRFEKLEGGYRLIPLPDSRAFEIRLRPQAFGFSADQVTSMIARDLYGGGWEHRKSPVVDGELRWKHDPRIFAYDLILR